MPALVSILIPAFNAGPWIEETIGSALAQTHPAVEIIVVDDGSTDDTLKRARAFESRGVRVVTQTNAGASASRNHALRLAQGDYFQFLDADDLLSPEKIAAQLALLTRHAPETPAICRWGRFCDDPASTIFADDDLARDFQPLEWMRLHCGEGRMMHPAAWLIPRSLAELAGPWDERLSLNDDGEYFARIALASRQIVCAPAPQAQTYYRSGLPGSLSRSCSPKAMASLHLSVSLISNAVSLADESPITRQALADYWQRVHLDLLIEAPDLAEEAAAHVRDFGGSKLRAGGGFAFQSLMMLIGLRSALKLRRAVTRQK